MERLRSATGEAILFELSEVGPFHVHSNCKPAQMKSKNPSSSNPNLRGYARVGKRFIHPLKAHTNMSPVSYVDEILPELFWLGLIHDMHGFHFAADAVKTLSNLTKDWPTKASHSNFALQSTYRDITDDQKTQLVKAWEDLRYLKGIANALAPLILLYDHCPLSFVGPPSELISQDAMILRLKECVENHIDRYSNKAVILIGYMMLSRIEAETIKFVKGVEIPDFNAIYSQPDSESAKKAAGFIRAGAYGEFGMVDRTSNWPEFFWNRGAELTECELPEWLSDEQD